MPERVDAALTQDERAILACGLIEWGGPATPTDAIAHLLGFADVQELHGEGGRIARALRSGEALTPGDWRRALMATELVFASDLVGSGTDWSITTAFSDETKSDCFAALGASLRASRGNRRAAVPIAWDGPDAPQAGPSARLPRAPTGASPPVDQATDDHRERLCEFTE
jgi:hypothetical protein